jgi:CheY-like chemotaxis protein
MHLRTRGQILIAEDDQEFRTLLVQCFRKLGYDVTECRHGVELIGQLACLEQPARPDDFDLIITDIRMPGVTGLSVLEGLREFTNAPPVILITAFGDEETHAAANRFGAAAVIDKPFEMADLLAKAQEILSGPSTAQSTEPD